MTSLSPHVLFKFQILRNLRSWILATLTFKLNNRYAVHHNLTLMLLVEMRKFLKEKMKISFKESFGQNFPTSQQYLTSANRQSSGRNFNVICNCVLNLWKTECNCRIIRDSGEFNGGRWGRQTQDMMT